MPTAVPTTIPSTIPTVVPTKLPTSLPTEIPTSSPTPSGVDLVGVAAPNNLGSKKTVIVFDYNFYVSVAYKMFGFLLWNYTFRKICRNFENFKLKETIF